MPSTFHEKQLFLWRVFIFFHLSYVCLLSPCRVFDGRDGEEKYCWGTCSQVSRSCTSDMCLLTLGIPVRQTQEWGIAHNYLCVFKRVNQWLSFSSLIQYHVTLYRRNRSFPCAALPPVSWVWNCRSQHHCGYVSAVAIINSETSGGTGRETDECSLLYKTPERFRSYLSVIWGCSSYPSHHRWRSHQWTVQTAPRDQKVPRQRLLLWRTLPDHFLPLHGQLWERAALRWGTPRPTQRHPYPSL